MATERERIAAQTAKDAADRELQETALADPSKAMVDGKPLSEIHTAQFKEHDAERKTREAQQTERMVEQSYGDRVKFSKADPALLVDPETAKAEPVHSEADLAAPEEKSAVSTSPAVASLPAASAGVKTVSEQPTAKAGTGSESTPEAGGAKQ